MREGRIAEVAAYCETDVENTYRVWLRYELFRGRLTENGLRTNEVNLSDYIRSHSNTKPHQGYALIDEQTMEPEHQCQSATQSGAEVEIFVPDTPGI